MAGSSSQSGSSFVPGSLVAGKYRLIKSIGEGAMGVVWSAVNEMTSGKVALKLIWKPEPEYRQRLLREAQACGRLRHKNIIQIHDVGMTEAGDPFLVMELLAGETLADLLARKRRLPPAEASAIGRDIARGLSVAHDAGIVHRDLKPANIFLHSEPGEDRPVVKVLDFGVAKNLANNDGLRTATGGAVGSPMYMSPEQARRAPDIDYRADLWSLGVVMFEMLTGERPFRGDLAEVLHQIQRGDIPTVGRRIRKIDPELDALVSGCLTRDLDERLGPAGEIASLLDRHAEPEGRGRLPSLPDDPIRQQLAQPGDGPPTASSSEDGALTSSSGSHPRAPEPRPSSTGPGAVQSPGYGGQSPGYGAGQSPGYGGQSPGYAAGQSPGYAAGQSPGYGTGGIGLTATAPGAVGLQQTAPIGAVGGAYEHASTARMQPWMMAPRPGSGAFPAAVVTAGEIGPSGTVRIDPDAVAQAIAARGHTSAEPPSPLPAPPRPTASNPGSAPGASTGAASLTAPLPQQTAAVHATIPMQPSPVASSTAPLFQAASAAPPSSVGRAGDNRRKRLFGVIVGVVGVSLMAGVALFVVSRRQAGSGGADPFPGATATMDLTAPVIAPPPPSVVPTEDRKPESPAPTTDLTPPLPTVTVPPKPAVTAPPKPVVTAPPKPVVTPPLPAVTAPPKPAVTVPPKPVVTAPPKSTSGGCKNTFGVGCKK
ncbi:MAG: protein kinase [Polyangiaceae bacterium]